MLNNYFKNSIYMKKILLFLPLIALVSVMTSCDSVAQQSVAATTYAAPYKDVDAQSLKKMRQENPNLVVIDVRTQQEVSRGVIEGSLHLDISNPSFAQEFRKLDRSKTYVVYCHSGVRSANACKAMSKEGFGNLYNLKGGIVAWNAGK
jgi:rhodanese-related sulfurtransferase